jgi:hypothetical protein
LNVDRNSAAMVWAGTKVHIWSANHLMYRADSWDTSRGSARRLNSSGQAGCNHSLYSSPRRLMAQSLFSAVVESGLLSKLWKKDHFK